MASRNTTATTVISGREHRRRHCSQKDQSSSFVSFADHFNLTTAIPSLTLNSPPSPQALLAHTNPFQAWNLSPLEPEVYLKEEPTRIQLQRQRLRDLHANTHLSTKFPGIKTSAAFFASLRTNLRLSVSPPPSPMSTPPSMRASASSLSPPSPAVAPADIVDTHGARPASDPLAGVPELTSYRAATDEDKRAALKLVADSIAQMRQNANNHLTLHPLLVAILIPILGIFAHVALSHGRDWIMVGLGWLGLFMSFLAACRYATQGYLNAAEELKWEWLGDAEVLVTKFGDEIIGTIMIDWVSGESRQKRKKAWQGEIKAWTVRLKYRRKGVGLALLEDTVQEAKNKGAETLEFAPAHANALRMLPAFFNKPFDRQEQKLKKLLADLWDNNSKGKRR